PNAVDPELLRARPDGGAYRTELGIDTQAFVIGSVSTLTHYEGFDTLIQAADHLHRQGHHIRILLVGDGAARDDLRAQARRLGLEKICLLPGRVSPKEALRAQAALDVMVVPRLDRRVCRLVTPLKPVEAMALGIPVVASDLPALRELLDDGNSGTLVPAEDPQALAEAVGVLMEDTALRRQQVKAAREQVLTTRTWERNATVYRALHTELGATSCTHRPGPTSGSSPALRGTERLFFASHLLTHRKNQGGPNVAGRAEPNRHGSVPGGADDACRHRLLVQLQRR